MAADTGQVQTTQISEDRVKVTTLFFSYAWKYAKRQQPFLLLLTLASFAFLYASLELPTRINSDATGTRDARATALGVQMTQVQLLLLPRCAFLASVLVSSLLKTRITTKKDVLARRLLRRLHFAWISRMMRHPKSHFRTTSQRKIVTMVTAEPEPMGDAMGDRRADRLRVFPTVSP